MKLLSLTLLNLLFVAKILVFDFNKTTKSTDWTIIDDGVMGGGSNGNFDINDLGHGIFFGKVSTENNGGFSSVKHLVDISNIKPNTKINMKLKGDGKPYQLRIKAQNSTYYSYIKTFETSGLWEIISINLNELHPSFRGRDLNMPNFSANTIQEIVFLIGNKKNESFELQLDEIYLEN